MAEEVCPAALGSKDPLGRRDQAEDIVRKEKTYRMVDRTHRV